MDRIVVDGLLDRETRRLSQFTAFIDTFVRPAWDIRASARLPAVAGDKKKKV